jgi:hypothetical protein
MASLYKLQDRPEWQRSSFWTTVGQHSGQWKELGPTLAMAINVFDTFKPAQIPPQCFLLVSDISVIAQSLAIVCYCCLHFCRRSTRVFVKLKAWVFQLFDHQLNTFGLVRETEKTKSPGVAYITIQNTRRKCRRSVA